MPLDSTDFPVVPPRLLSQLSIVPISETRVMQWQTYMIKKFAARNSHNRHLVDSGLACWRSVGAFPLAFFSETTLGRAAPKNVRQLADKIAAADRCLYGSIAEFDRDPILYAHGETERYCIAIWDAGVVRAIAEGARLSVGQRALRVFSKLA